MSLETYRYKEVGAETEEGRRAVNPVGTEFKRRSQAALTEVILDVFFWSLHFLSSFKKEHRFKKIGFWLENLI